jgi:hypothetical protein
VISGDLRLTAPRLGVGAAGGPGPTAAPGGVAVAATPGGGKRAGGCGRGPAPRQEEQAQGNPSIIGARKVPDEATSNAQNQQGEIVSNHDELMCNFFAQAVSHRFDRQPVDGPSVSWGALSSRWRRGGAGGPSEQGPRPAAGRPLAPRSASPPCEPPAPPQPSPKPPKPGQDALAYGKSALELRSQNVPDYLIPHRLGGETGASAWAQSGSCLRGGWFLIRVLF